MHFYKKEEIKAQNTYEYRNSFIGSNFDRLFLDWTRIKSKFESHVQFLWIRPITRPITWNDTEYHPYGFQQRVFYDQSRFHHMDVTGP